MGFFSSLFERRYHPSQTPPDWVLSSGWETDTGVTVTPDSALQMIAVFGAVRVLAETLASLPLHVYRRLADGGRARAEDYFLYPLLHNQPNGEMTSFQLRETLMGHLALWGNAYAEIEYNNAGRPIALWPLRPDKMKLERRNGQLVYVYTLPKPMVNGQYDIDLLPQFVLHIRGLSPNGLVGYSPISLARQGIGLGLAAESFGSRFFGNDARPGAVLKHPNTLSGDAHERLIGSWETRHQGLEKSHRMAILEEGMEYQQIGIPPEDAQFLETRKFQNTEIARLYRIPPHMLADLDRATFSNVEQQSIDFVTYTMTPWLVRWEQDIERSLIPPSDRKTYFAEFLVDGLLRGDTGSRYSAYAIGRQNGWLSANDIRRLENMNPVDGGDVYLVPLNMIPANDVGEMRSQSVEHRHNPAARRQELRGQRSAANRRRLADSHLRIYQDVAARILRREANDVSGAARKYLASRNVAEFDGWLYDFYNEHESFVRTQMEPVATAYSELVAAQAAEEVETEPDNDAVQRFINSYVGSYSRRHVGISRARIQAALEANIEDPLTAVEEVTSSWRDENDRAATIAADESNRTNNAVSKFIYSLAGISLLRWLTFGDNCPYCRSLNGAQIGIDDWFIPAGTEFEPEGAETPLTTSTNIGHPPAHRGCDCLIIAGVQL